MSVDAFGYPSMSIVELRDALTLIIEAHPRRGEQPFWVDAHAEVLLPVKAIRVNEWGNLILVTHGS